MPDPIAFMVMPFNRKPTGQKQKKVPSEVDFDALWERVYEPILKELGYRPVRADRDVGALIINQMIQRLAVADVVVADITLPNANVYYEIGVRHAAKEKGCVLVGADWAQPVFDLKQMRALRFPLADGDVGKKAAKKALAALRKDLEALVKGISPVFGAVPGFPQSDETRIAAFEDDVAELSKFDGDIRARRYLDLAIEAYQRGMEVDLNDFYPTSNLARLYRARSNPGDEQLAAEAAVAAKAACRAAIENGPTDEWTKATLLGVAFDQGDVPEAVRLGPQVEADGAETWKLEATIDDLRTSVANQGDPETRATLQAVLDRLETLVAD